MDFDINVNGGIMYEQVDIKLMMEMMFMYKIGQLRTDIMDYVLDSNQYKYIGNMTQEQ